ncbi:MAG: OmpH family outer membrane protein [Candidatus Oxydemutatoraceae bacterium WSBS_2016_MAG_OTU14]
MTTNNKKRTKTYKYLTAMIAALTMMLTSAVYAQGETNSKIGFVNIPLIMEESSQAKEAQKRLRERFSDTREELSECSKSLELLDTKLRSEGKDMTEDRRERMIETITRKRRECGEIQSELQSKFNKKRGEELQGLQKLISRIITDIAEEEKFNIVLGPPVLYKDKQADLTDKVLKRLNKEK